MAPPTVMPPALVPSPARVLRRSIFVVDQILRASQKIGDGISLGAFAAAAVPILTVFPAAANVRHRYHAAALQPRQRSRIERRIIGNAIRPISVQQRGMRAIHLQPALMNNGKRHHSAIRSLGFHLFRFNARKIHRRRRNNFGIGYCIGLRIVMEKSAKI